MVWLFLFITIYVWGGWGAPKPRLMGAGWHLAQVNIGRLVAPEGDPRVQPFFEALDRVNVLAEASPGFVWRLTGEGNNATDLRPTPDPQLAVNMSVWTDADTLFAFVYRSAHTPVMARRRDYFERFDGAFQAMWWIRRAKSRPCRMLFRDCGCSTVTDRPRTLSPSRRVSPRRVSTVCRSIISPIPGVSEPRDPAAPRPLDVALKGLCPRCGAPGLFAGW